MPGLATTFVNPVSITLDSQRSSLLGAGGGFCEAPVGNQTSPHIGCPHFSVHVYRVRHR